MSGEDVLFKIEDVIRKLIREKGKQGDTHSKAALRFTGFIIVKLRKDGLVTTAWFDKTLKELLEIKKQNG